MKNLFPISILLFALAAGALVLSLPPLFDGPQGSSLLLTAVLTVLSGCLAGIMLTLRPPKGLSGA